MNTRTSALSAIYDALGKQFEKFVANFEPWRDQVGMLVAINGIISGVEMFESKQCFREDGMRLLMNSYVPEALRGEKVPILPDDVAVATEAFTNELRSGKRRFEIVTYNGQFVYANAV